DSHADHQQHDHADPVDQIRRRLWVLVVLGIAAVAFNPMFADLLGYRLQDSTCVWWISPILVSRIDGWGEHPLLSAEVSERRGRQPGMMLLIGVAITVAFVASWGATLGILDAQLNVWLELALLVIIMLLGHWIEMRSLAQTTSALDSLAALLPDE